MTDEILDPQQVEDSKSAAVQSSGFSNEWGEKLTSFAANADQFNRAFSREELGDGQLMTGAEASRIIAQNQLRKNAGDARNAQLDADLSWGDVRIKEAKLQGKQLERGIQQAKNVVLGNELLFQVGKIKLHGEKRHLQLHQMQNQVRSLRNSVKISTERLGIAAGESGDSEVSFIDIEVEE